MFTSFYKYKAFSCRREPSLQYIIIINRLSAMYIPQTRWEWSFFGTAAAQAILVTALERQP